MAASAVTLRHRSETFKTFRPHVLPMTYVSMYGPISRFAINHFGSLKALDKLDSDLCCLSIAVMHEESFLLVDDPDHRIGFDENLSNVVGELFQSTVVIGSFSPSARIDQIAGELTGQVMRHIFNKHLALTASTPICKARRALLIIKVKEMIIKHILAHISARRT